MLLRRAARITPDLALVHATSRIVQSGGDARMHSIARESGLSIRQLQRRFLTSVGLAPKTLARVARLQYALAIARSHLVVAERGAYPVAAHASLARIAVASGYADHAHFTREFRRIAGIPPSAFFREQHGLNDLFAERAD
jgi:AraC-like DNA-binding protein